MTEFEHHDDVVRTDQPRRDDNPVVGGFTAPGPWVAPEVPEGLSAPDELYEDAGALALPSAAEIAAVVGYETGEWAGQLKYSCLSCNWDTLDEDRIREHVAAHQVVEDIASVREKLGLDLVGPSGEPL